MASKSRAVTRPNLGLYLDRPAIEVPPRGLTAGRNFRIVNGRLTNQGMGWQKFSQKQLNGPVLLIDNFFLRGGGQIVVFGTDKDLYRYDEVNDNVFFITPRYETGTVAVTNGSPTVTGTGTTWTTNLKAGDQLHVGATGQNAPAAIWYTIQTVNSNTQLTLTVNYAQATASGQAYTGRKLFTGDIKAYWNTETFPKAQPADKDLWYATNEVDFVVEWDGTATQVTLLSGLGFRCSTLRRYKNIMVYGNLLLTATGEARPYSIRTSDVANPTNVSTGLASEFIVHDGVDAVNALLTLGDSLVIYGSRTITVSQFVGGAVRFVFRGVIHGLGPQAGRLLADFGDFHEFVGPDSAYRFDGVSVEEIGFQIWREAIRKRDPSRTALGHSHFDEERGILIWAIPQATDPSTEGPKTAYLEHYVEDIAPTTPVPYSQQDWTFTATGFFERLSTLRFSDILTSWATQGYRWNDQFFQAAFPLNLGGSHDGWIYSLGTADSFNGAAISSFVRFARQPAFDERHKGIVRRIYPFAEHMPGSSSYDLGVILWTAEQAAGSLTNKGQLLYDLQHVGPRFVSHRQSARFFEVEFATAGIGNIWFLQGYDVDIVPGGER